VPLFIRDVEPVVLQENAPSYRLEIGHISLDDKVVNNFVSHLVKPLAELVSVIALDPDLAKEIATVRMREIMDRLLSREPVVTEIFPPVPQKLA